MKQEEGKYTIDLGLKMTKREETIYKDNEVNSRMLILSVKDGMVHLNEGDHGPACGMMNGGSSAWDC